MLKEIKNERDVITNVDLFNEIILKVKGSGKWPDDLIDYSLASTYDKTGLYDYAFDPYNQYLWIEFGCDAVNIAIHVAVFLIFVAVIVLSVFYMLSGGKKDLLGKEKESVFIYEDHLMVFYYLPKGKYKAIKNNIYFCDIRSMEYDDRKKRLAIKSDCQIQKSKDLASINSIEDAELDDKENCTTYIYAKYKDFETIMKKVETLSLKKISSDSALYAE